MTSVLWPEHPVAMNTDLAGRVLGVLSLTFAGNLGVLSTNSVTGDVWELIPKRTRGRGLGGVLPQWSMPQQYRGRFSLIQATLHTHSRVKFSYLLVHKQSVHV